MPVALKPGSPNLDYAGFVGTQQTHILMTCTTPLAYAVFLAAIAAVVRKERRSWIIFSALATLQLLATINVISYMLGLHLALPGEIAEITWWALLATPTYSATATGSNVCIHLTFLLSDALVVWRAWVLWPDSRIARLTLSFCMLGRGAGAVADFYFKSFSVTFTGPVIATNLAATTLVGLKTWVYRRQIAIWLGHSSGNSRIGRVLMLLLDSGLIFCSVCIAWTMMTLVDFSHALMPVMQGFAEIYATLVILVIAVQEHLTSDPALAGQSSFLASIRFLSHDEEPEEQAATGQ